MQIQLPIPGLEISCTGLGSDYQVPWFFVTEEDSGQALGIWVPHLPQLCCRQLLAGPQCFLSPQMHPYTVSSPLRVKKGPTDFILKLGWFVCIRTLLPCPEGWETPHQSSSRSSILEELFLLPRWHFGAASWQKEAHCVLTQQSSRRKQRAAFL